MMMERKMRCLKDQKLKKKRVVPSARTKNIMKTEHENVLKENDLLYEDAEEERRESITKIENAGTVVSVTSHFITNKLSYTMTPYMI